MIKNFIPQPYEGGNPLPDYVGNRSEYVLIGDAPGGYKITLAKLTVGDSMSAGNPLAHAILRGSVNPYGQTQPNYHYEDLLLLLHLYQEKNLKNPACVVDTNHSNSNKQYLEQIRITKEVLHSRQYNPDIHKLVKGLMIESYIEDGSQGIHDKVYGKSITDPCLGWEKTERLLYEIAEKC